MSRISPRKAARARPRSDRSTGDNRADHSGFSAIRASATLAGAGCCGDLGASGTRLLHFRKRASWALMPRAQILAGRTFRRQIREFAFAVEGLADSPVSKSSTRGTQNRRDACNGALRQSTGYGSTSNPTLRKMPIERNIRRAIKSAKDLRMPLAAPCPKVSPAAIIYSATVSLPTIDNRQFSLDPAMPRCRGVGQF
jgi:hypothetical protein